MTEILAFLFGYPLSILANFSTTFLQNYFTVSDSIPFKSLFVKSFLNSLENNKKGVSEFGASQISKVQKIIEKDENVLFKIIIEAVGRRNSDITLFREKVFQDEIINKIFNEFNLSHISLAKNVLIDCLHNYEEQFYLNMSSKDGFHLVLNLLRKIDTEMPKKSDIDNLKQTLLLEIKQKEEKNENFKKLNELLIGEITNPESSKFSDPITSYFDTIKRIVKNLTEDQYQVIHFLRYKHRVTISGCAGSGKTLIAAEKALRLDYCGIKTLILTHNPYLVNNIKKLVYNSSVQVDDFTNFIYKLLNKDLIDIEKWNEHIEPMEEELYQALGKIINEKISYDAIIIDEGQDFRESWLLIIEEMSENSASKIMYIFHDDNQSLLPYRSKYPLSESPFTISKNCRNSGNIFEIVRKFHNNAPAISSFLKDTGVIKISTFSGTDINSVVIEGVRNSLSCFPSTNIAILTNEPSTQVSVLNGIKTLKTDSLYWFNFVKSDLHSFYSKAMNRIESLRRNSTESEIWNRFNIPNSVDIKEYLKVPTLSLGLFPTKKDIKLVSAYANKISPFFEGAVFDGVVFRIKNNSLCLYEESPEKRTERIAKTASKIKFYATEDWSVSLPKPKQIVITDNYHTFEGIEILKLFNIVAFKGLESDCVILFINTINSDLLKELYVGTSRAIGYLHIIINKRIYEKIQQLNDFKL